MFRPKRESIVNEATAGGVEIVPAATVDELAQEAGLSADESATLAVIYQESQLGSLRVGFFGLIVIAVGSLVFSRGIPIEIAGKKQNADAKK